VCVRACVRACMRACVRVRVRVRPCARALLLCVLLGLVLPPSSSRIRRSHVSRGLDIFGWHNHNKQIINPILDVIFSG
jgi:hypothetical protein